MGVQPAFPETKRQMRTPLTRYTASPDCPLIAEAVEELGPELGSIDPYCYKQPSYSRHRLMPGWVLVLWSVWLSFLHMDQAIIGLGGGIETRLTRRFRFCTAASSRNSSLAPVRPRSLSLVSPRLRLASPNNLSIFLRSRADWL